ncbi:MAG: hypothetical protein HKN08_01810, partial [Gammaproteobacteria bacterium]|nr:hypothetical protein [Gammaproteobacteria bacterium]
MGSSNKIYFKKYIAVLFLILTSNTIAHIKNESSQFPDIEFSDSKFEIVLLVGAGVIPETPVFEPDLVLSKMDLAAWAALASGLAEGGETPDMKKLSDAAVNEGIIESIDGNATFQDINNLLFNGLLSPQQPESIPSKGEAASFIANNLTTDINGETLLDRRGMRVGPVGEISEVESRQNPDGGSSYYITIAGETYPLYTHGRVANGPTDLIQWKGRSVRRSFLKQLGDFTLWIYLEAEPVQAGSASGRVASAVSDESTSTQNQIATNHTLLYSLVAGVLVL